MNLLKWKPEVESFDSNAYQDSLRQIIEKKKDELRLPIKIKRVYTFKDKYRRFLDLARLVEQHKVYLLKSQHELLEEMITYPKGKTNDLLDALHLSIEAPKQRVASGFELI